MKADIVKSNCQSCNMYSLIWYHSVVKAFECDYCS
jgi:hypothetical protein